MGAREDRRRAERQARGDTGPGPVLLPGVPNPAADAALTAYKALHPDTRLQPSDLAGLDPAGWTEGDPTIVSHPAATDGTPESRSDARILATREVARLIDAQGGKALGEVVFYEWGPVDVPEVLASLMRDDDRFRQLAPWYVEHPEGTLIIAAVVAQPAQPQD